MAARLVAERNVYIRHEYLKCRNGNNLLIMSWRRLLQHHAASYESRPPHQA